MTIGGLQKLTLIDYPEHLAAIIFTQGCNFRCHFCYNPKLVVPQLVVPSGTQSPGHSLINEDGLFGFLSERQKKLDAVVITGGEPTLHSDLPEFIKKIKRLGYLVKLDTNGTNPEMLKNLLNAQLIDYLAMDLKAPLTKYNLVTGVKAPLNNIAKSIKIIISSGLPYEFRTTIVPEFHQIEDLEKMGEMIKGAAKWYLQKFQSGADLVDEKFKGKKSYKDKEMDDLRKIALKYVKLCGVR
ncbi:MAG: anaerobic ribonucleoside-triphosphate reductase activating protein [Patescibacteria group bacterium]